MPGTSRNNSSALNDLERDHELRRIAVEIAVQLPDDREDALLVLQYARELVTEFLPGRPPATPKIHPVS